MLKEKPDRNARSGSGGGCELASTQPNIATNESPTTAGSPTRTMNGSPAATNASAASNWADNTGQIVTPRLLPTDLATEGDRAQAEAAASRSAYEPVPVAVPVLGQLRNDR